MRIELTFDDLKELYKRKMAAQKNAAMYRKTGELKYIIEYNNNCCLIGEVLIHYPGEFYLKMNEDEKFCSNLCLDKNFKQMLKDKSEELGIFYDC